MSDACWFRSSVLQGKELHHVVRPSGMVPEELDHWPAVLLGSYEQSDLSLSFVIQCKIFGLLDSSFAHSNLTQK